MIPLHLSMSGHQDSMTVAGTSQSCEAIETWPLILRPSPFGIRICGFSRHLEEEFIPLVSRYFGTKDTEAVPKVRQTGWNKCRRREDRGSRLNKKRKKKCALQNFPEGARGKLNRNYKIGEKQLATAGCPRWMGSKWQRQGGRNHLCKAISV